MIKILLLVLCLIIPAYSHASQEMLASIAGRVYCSYVADSSPFDAIGSGSTVVRMEVRGQGGSDDGEYWTGSAWTVTATTLTNSNLTFYRGGLWYVSVTPSSDMTGITVNCFTSDSSGIPYDYAENVYPANRFNDNTDYVRIVGGTGGTISGIVTTTLDLSGGVTSNDQWNSLYSIRVYNPTTGGMKAASCITDTVNGTPDQVVTAVDISTLIATSDTFDIVRDTACNVSVDAAAIADAVWDEPKADHTTTTTFGDLATDLNTVAVDVAGLDGAAMRGTDGAYTGTPPTAGAIADAVWDEPTFGHTAADTFGEQAKTDIDAILLDTAEIGTAGAGLTNINLPDQTMDITGNLYGCDGCIAVTVISGAATMASPAILSDAGIITVDNQFKGQILRCGKQERKIAKTVNTTDSIVVEPGNPFVETISSCYIK